MNYKNKENKLFQLFNRNIPIENRYSDDEIKHAFSKEDYSSGSKKEQLLYIIFFKECTKNEDINDLVELYNINITKIKGLYKSFSDKRKIEFGVFWSNRFNLPIISTKILPRNHDTYAQIDNFQIYELTPCIAYELAIRNKQVKELLAMHDKISKMLRDDKYIMNIHMSKNHFSFMYKIKERKELDKKYHDYESLYEKKQANYRKRIIEDYKKFINENIDMCTELHISTLSELEEKITKELINDYLIYPKGYQREVPGASVLYQEEISNSKKEEKKSIINKTTDGGDWQIRFEEIINKEFIQVQGIHINSNEYFVNNIVPNFNRQVNDQNQINIPINFALPLEEIVEYITKIKIKLNPLTPLELLGDKLSNASDLTDMNTTNSKGKKITLNATKGESPQEKLADMLYIYDMKKNGFTNTDLIYELKEKYSDKKTSPDAKTLKKYFDIATEYIEHKKYKELLTGKTIF